jgi:pre-mRNA-processing factor 19
MGGITVSQGAVDVEMSDEPEGAGGLPSEVVARIDETHAVLSAGRKKRQVPSTYADNELVKTYKAKHTIPSLHSPSPAGITSLALSVDSPSLFLTGGNDKVVQLYDRESDKVVAQLKGHTKKVNHVAFRDLAGQPRLLLSGSADKTVRVWAHDSASNEYAPKSTVRTHKGEISGLVVHPTSTLVTIASLDKTYSVLDLTTFESIFQSPASDEAYTSLSIHPDGALMALGTPNSALHIYDIRTGALAATLEPEDGASSPFVVGSSSFSERGYHLAAPDSTGTVAIWDLRKQKRVTSIGAGEGAKVNRVMYDTSAQYLGVAASTGLKVFAHKTWEELASFDEGGEVSDVGFGPDGKEIWGAAGREIRIWGEA